MSSPALTGSTTVHVLRTAAELARIRAHWDRCETHPTCEWNACEALVAASGGATKTLVFVHGDLDAPRAMLVAMDARTHVPVTFGYWRVANPDVRVLSVKHGGGWLGPADRESATALVSALRQEMRDHGATMLHLEHFPVDHPLVEAATAHGATRVRPEPDVNWRVAIPESYAAFLAGCSKNTRRNLKRYPERFLEEFGARAVVHVLHRPEDFGRIQDEMEAVASHSYHRSLGAGFLKAPEQCALIQAALARGTYRAWLLHIDGKPAAFWDGRRSGGVFFTDFTAYLPEYRDARPGWYLLSRVIEELCADPDVEAIDFGQGDAQYKQMLGTISSQEISLAMYAPTFRGRSLKTLVRTTAGSSRFAKRMLDRVGLTGKIKRLWRKRLADEPAKADEAPKADEPAKKSDG